ncbi:hypothetical protein [Saccharothrix longispora]|uniref:hypothetical protein n=1 Tax=Saccharothrix longispora TaxID=33920 RepID=UPI0028FDBF6A|nr:hypothetical protein [Saccharothrix longispora]MBY8848777.1 hypothetical protein [Saccharothrix sp. MB29]MDU0293282.1 hypothetical protein [Saccharothrix longispora]
MAETSTAGRAAFTVLLRVVVSAVVGAVLLIAWVWAYRTGVLDRVVDETTLSEFILLVVVGLPIALLVSALLAGPVLWLLRVRPVWPVVLIGPVLLGLAHYFALPEQWSGLGDRWTVLVLLAAASYGLAGLLTAPAALRRRK